MTLSSATEAALEAYHRGWTPVPIVAGQKRPALPAWQHKDYGSDADVAETFKLVQAEHTEPLGVGLVLGAASGNLVDVDLDHPKALRLKELFLPPTPMVSGRATTRRSHHWYIVTDDLPPGTKRYSMPSGEVSVELRSTGGQTVIPPSIHPTGEPYMWEDEPWGGEEGPARIRGNVLGVRVASLAMGCVIVDGWPARGGRHEAYLALAGGLLRYGRDEDGGAVHPLWEKALPNLIRTIALATDDEDGPDTRSAEVMESTMSKLRVGGKVQGFPTLARLIGGDHADLIRRYARDIESLSGHATRPEAVPRQPDLTEEGAAEDPGEKHARLSLLPPADRNPLEERDSTWEPVDLAPYLDGGVKVPQPTILRRADGMGLFYPGRVNYLYGASETGKSWVTLYASKEQIEDGQHVLFIDCEDDPATAILRMKDLGCADDDLRARFTYVHPESPISPLSRNSYGDPNPTDTSKRNYRALVEALETSQPDLVIVDGLTVLYGLHGLNTNDASNTEVITGFMRSLTKGGERTVIVIDHTGKGAGRGATPLGSQHKIAMVQGTALQVHAITRPRPGYMGEVELVVGKDRPGVVRGAAGASGDHHIAADVVMDSTVPRRMVMTFKVPVSAQVMADSDEMSDRLATLDQDRTAIVTAMKKAPGPLGKKELMLALPEKLSDSRYRQAIQSLKNDETIDSIGGGRSLRYVLI